MSTIKTSKAVNYNIECMRVGGGAVFWLNSQYVFQPESKSGSVHCYNADKMAELTPIVHPTRSSTIFLVICHNMVFLCTAYPCSFCIYVYTPCGVQKIEVSSCIQGASWWTISTKRQRWKTKTKSVWTHVRSLNSSLNWAVASTDQWFSWK